MHYKRAMVVLLIVAAALASFGPGFAVETTTYRHASAQGDDALSIGLMINTGSDLMDGGFNESAWDALLIVEEEQGANIEFLQPVDPEDTADDLRDLASRHDIVVTVGFALAEATVEVSQEYPDVRFIGIDQFQVTPIENLTGLIFPEDQGGFLAGVLAASLTQTGQIAGVFGTVEAPPIVAFEYGYRAGAEWAAEHWGREVEVANILHPGTAFDAFNDPEWGATTAATLVDGGADVVFAAAGETGNGALEEVAFAADFSEDPVYCIGVDTDQWETVEAAHPCLVSSATKLIVEGVLELIEAYQDGSIRGGNYLGDVGLADFHDFEDEIPEDVKALMTEVEQDLRSGALLTCYNLEFDGFSVGLVANDVAEGTLGAAVWDSIQAMSRCGAEVSLIEAVDDRGVEDAIASFADDEFNSVVLLTGEGLNQTVSEAVSMYPDLTFVAINKTVPGVASLVLENEESTGSLIGYLTGLAEKASTE